VQARVEVDKRQMLALLGGEGFCRATHSGHPIQLFVRASNEEEARMNVRYRVELSQAERNELTARPISNRRMSIEARNRAAKSGRLLSRSLESVPSVFRVPPLPCLRPYGREDRKSAVIRL
jgi:hypothetical protein